MLQNEYSLDVFTYNTLIDGLSKEGKLDEARKLFNKMSVCLNVVTCNAVIDGFCKEGKLDDDINLLHEMTKQNLCADVFTYNMLINSLGKEEQC